MFKAFELLNASKKHIVHKFSLFHTLTFSILHMMLFVMHHTVPSYGIDHPFQIGVYVSSSFLSTDINAIDSQQSD